MFGWGISYKEESERGQRLRGGQKPHLEGASQACYVLPSAGPPQAPGLNSVLSSLATDARAAQIPLSQLSRSALWHLEVGPGFLSSLFLVRLHMAFLLADFQC